MGGKAARQARYKGGPGQLLKKIREKRVRIHRKWGPSPPIDPSKFPKCPSFLPLSLTHTETHESVCSVF